jgi:drug/metabolite transporter (DMT)-like permease
VPVRPVARLPVALALLAFNTYPLWTALWARVLYGHRPERAVLLAMPVMLVGLALALDVFGAASGLGAPAQWAHRRRRGLCADRQPPPSAWRW